MTEFFRFFLARDHAENAFVGLRADPQRFSKNCTVAREEKTN